MPGWLFNNTLFVKDNNNCSTEDVEKIKETLSRLMLSTAGLYKYVGENDFALRMRLGEESTRLAIRVTEGKCYVGVYDTVTRTLSTTVDAEKILKINQDSLGAYITKLARIESYYNKNGKLPMTATDAKMIRMWDRIIGQIKIDRKPEPTKIADIKLEDGTNVSKMFWDSLKSIDNKIINKTLFKEIERDDEER